MQRRVPLLPVIAVLLYGACSSPTATDEGEEGCRVQPAEVHDPLTQRGAVRDVHDPAVIEEGGRYYLFSTGHGIPIRRSDDLVDWSPAGQVFAELPAWASSTIPGVAFPWAPDVAHFGGRYHLYYSLSTFGSQRSAIGLATNETLDPTSPAYAWVDRGVVVASRPGVDDFNAIDPNVAFDASGQPWLAWGSFWGGIRMRRLDAETGLLSEADGTVHALAARTGVPAIEAPFIVRHDDLYYLFVSFDSCCQGAASSYKVMVGRSDAITGPYVDRAGQPMTAGGGTLVLEGYGRIRGPGHNAVLVDDDRAYLVHHFYDAEGDGVPTLQVRALLWDDEGWPLAGDPYDGTFPTAAPPAAVAGTWAHAVGGTPPFEIELRSDGTLGGCRFGGSWSLEENTLTLRWSGVDGPASGEVERVTVSADGSWYVGRTDDGALVRGARVVAAQKKKAP